MTPAPTAGGRRVAARFADAILALALLAATDVALFHAGRYFPWLKPDSYSGRVERSARRLAWSIRNRPDVKRVIVMGNSVAGSGIDERMLDEGLAARGLDLRSLNLAEGGASPNAWLPLLRSLPVDERTTAAVVLGIYMPGLSGGMPDIQISKTRMGVRDALWLAGCYPGWERPTRVTLGAFFRLPWYREDVLDLLASPRRRLREVAGQARGDAASLGMPRVSSLERSLGHVEVDADGRVSFAGAESWLRQDAGTREAIEKRIARQLSVRHRRKPLPMVDAGFLRSLEALVRLLHDRRVRVIWAVLPESPFPTGRRDLRDVGSLRARLRVDGIDVPTFQDLDTLALLEQPCYFADHLHPNQKGADIYTRALAAFLAGHLGPGAPAELPPPRPVHTGRR